MQTNGHDSSTLLNDSVLICMAISTSILIEGPRSFFFRLLSVNVDAPCRPSRLTESFLLRARRSWRRNRERLFTVISWGTVLTGLYWSFLSPTEHNDAVYNQIDAPQHTMHIDVDVYSLITCSHTHARSYAHTMWWSLSLKPKSYSNTAEHDHTRRQPTERFSGRGLFDHLTGLCD